jgi:hypothetical protein
MDRSDLTIGGTFWCGEQPWRCTDIGTRTIVAIRIDGVEVAGTEPGLRWTLGHSAAAELRLHPGKPRHGVGGMFARRLISCGDGQMMEQT